MKFVDLLKTTQEAVAQTLGEDYMNKSGLLKATESFKIADVGEKILETENTVEPFTKSLITVLAKTEMFDDEYNRKITSLWVDNFEWGGFVQRVYFGLADIIADPMYSLVNKKNYSEIDHTFYQPNTAAKIFQEGKAIMVPISIVRDQLKEAFKSWDDLNRYVSGIRTTVRNTLNLALYSYQKMLVSCGIAMSVSTAATALNNAVHLITEAKENGVIPNTVTTYNDIIALGDDTHRRFLTFVAQRIATIRDNMREFTTAYNDGNIPTFADGDNNRLLLNSQFAKDIRFNARANTFNSNELAFGDYEEIPSWQAIVSSEAANDTFKFDTVTSINLAADATNKLGIGTEGLSKSGIIGVAFDRRAMGITLIREKTTSTYTACADFWNEFVHLLTNYILDTTFSLVAFVLD